MIWINWIAYMLALMFVVILIALAVSEIKEFAEKVKRVFGDVEDNRYLSNKNERHIDGIRESLNHLKREYLKLYHINDNNNRSINDITVTVSNLNKKINELEKQEEDNE